MEGTPMDDYFPCTPSPDCKYAKTDRGCFEDVHHYYQEPVPSDMARIFRNLPQNKVTACRRFHESVLDPNGLEYPDREAMRTEIIDAEFAGAICLSATKHRIVHKPS